MAIVSNRPATAFRQSILLMLQLHTVMMTRDPDGEEADSIRELMERPWHAMRADEQTLLRGLSADLYTLGQDRPEIVDPLSEQQTESLGVAIEAEDWLRVTALLRENESRLPPEQVACLRGLVWARLEHPEAAIPFLKEAIRLHFAEPCCELLLLTCQILAERTQDALPRAEELARSSTNPLLLLKAAEVFSVRATEESPEAARGYYGRAVESALRGLKLIGFSSLEQADRDAVKSQVISAYLHLAMNYEALENQTAARQAIQEALAIDPNNVDALMLLGWFDYQEFPPSQKDLFRKNHHRRLAHLADAFPPIANMPIVAG